MTESFENRVTLITGGAARVGKAIALHLHDAGGRVIVHYGQSQTAAEQLSAQMNAMRPHSAAIVQCDLLDTEAMQACANEALAAFGRIDFIVNNASTFFPTPIGTTTEQQWDSLIGVNLKAPYFLVQTLACELRKRQGAIVNLGDIYADQPSLEHPVYCAAKAGLLSLTRSFARELAPQVRANAVLPGAILWPENPSGANRDEILARTPLGRKGEVDDIASAVLYLLRDAEFVSGQQIAVDGGRSIVP